MLVRDFSIVVSSRGAELETQSVFEQILRDLQISHLFDIGANIGSFSWHALNVTPGLQVHLFEPDETNIRLLQKTIRSNKFTAVHLWTGVVSNQTEPIEFLVDDVSGATGSIGTSPAGSLQSDYGLKRTVKVRSTTLDAYSSPLTLKDSRILLKIDVEGAENEVFQGGREFFEKHRPVVIVECFVPSNLNFLIERDYTSVSLLEDNNFILIPNELISLLRDSATGIRLSLGQTKT